MSTKDLSLGAYHTWVLLLEILELALNLFKVVVSQFLLLNQLISLRTVLQNILSSGKSETSVSFSITFEKQQNDLCLGQIDSDGVLTKKQ